jgi:hypothetical protein
MANTVGNNFWEGSLGVVRIEFDSVDLGKTVDEANIEYIEDIKDIFYAQDGTQPADKYRTGAAYQVTASFGQITIPRIEKLIKGTEASGAGNSLKLSRELYLSMREQEGKVLIVRRVDSEGAVSTNPDFILNFYNAAPLVTGSTFIYGPDTQRVIEITFYVFFDETNLAFGYSGYASSLGLANVA